MARVVLVRHGAAAASFLDAVDPGLSADGRAQADGLPARLADWRGGELRTSPLRRARETAAPIEAAWGRSAAVERRIAEIPWSGDDLSERGDFLRCALQGTWTELAPEYRRWRDDVVGAVHEPAGDAIFVTHLVAINVVIGRAQADDRVLVRMVDNCSLTVVDTTGGVLQLVPEGASTA